MEQSTQSRFQKSDMNYVSPSRDLRFSPAYTPSKVDSHELTHVTQSQDHDDDRESSSDDVPLRQKRTLRAPTREREDSVDLRDHRQLQDHTRNANDTSVLDDRRAADEKTLRKPSKAVAKSTGKAPKKPGPRPWASKPIMKNDMAAKQEVIREIESYWGKAFIRSYIPKCHRPLVKRGKGGKRAMYRDHETDPKKWLPSVLKAILMIAKLTTSKTWLKKAMNDVVRYRIKNTGNRKPQLVTTDFDVIEDMLVKDWDVPYSFNIRYKHLLVNRQGQQDTDEDIDHILAVESGEEEGSDDDEEDDVKGVNSKGEDNIDEVQDSDEDLGEGSLTGQYLQASGYTNGPQQPLPYHTPGMPPKHSKLKQERISRRSSALPLRPQPPAHSKKGQQGYGQPYGYGPPMDPWGNPMPYGGGLQGYGGYGGYGMYAGYGGYVPPPDSGRHASQSPGFSSMGQFPPHHATTPAPSQPDTGRGDRRRTQDSPFGADRRMQGGFDQSPFSMSRPGFQPYGFSQNVQGSHPAVKQESPEVEMRGDRRANSVEECDTSMDGIGEDANDAAVEAELRATELELKVARLQAKRAAMKQQSRAK